jgi:hypothetical protein
MNTQPEALRLADLVEQYNDGVHSQSILEDYSKAATELRRLHEVKQMLVESLENAAYYVPEKTGAKRLLEYALAKAKE